MPDNFRLRGLDGGWFAENFENYHLFGYVGDRDRLMKELHQKSPWRRLVEVFAPRVSIAGLVNALAHYDLLKVDPTKSLGAEIIKLLTTQESQRTLNQLLSAKYKEARKNGRYFDRVAYPEYKTPTLCGADLNTLQDRLVTVEGQLLHRDTISQFSQAAAAPLRGSQGHWLLSDYPPHCMVDRNDLFKGELLLLREDPGFTETFRDALPFCPDIGWYPYVRVTGFFDASRLPVEGLRSLSICLVEYRRPKLYKGVRDTFVAFAKSELDQLNYLKYWSDQILLAYLPPILFRGTKLAPVQADGDLAAVLKRYLQLWKQDLPQALGPFYSSVP